MVGFDFKGVIYPDPWSLQVKYPQKAMTPSVDILFELCINLPEFGPLSRRIRFLNFRDLLTKKPQPFGETGGFEDFLAATGIT